MADEDGEEEPIRCKRKQGLQDDGWHILNEALTSLSDCHVEIKCAGTIKQTQ